MLLPFVRTALVLLLFMGTAWAQSPRVWLPHLRVPRAETPIEVASLDTRVVIHGLHAETTQTVVFFNPNDRVLEGELEFPLPDGATVSGYAIDVDGQLVDGTVVAKQKARVALETEVRRGVDPGLVEQVRGNVYRIRIYPIPARGSRTVRLRWVSELATRGTEAAYHLPLPVERPARGFGIRVEVVRAPVTPEVSGGFGNLVLRRWEDRWVAEAQVADATPMRDLLVRLPLLPRQVTAIEAGDGREAFFSVSDLTPGGGASRVAAPRRIALAWDASGSRDAERTEREIAFLRRLLAAWPTAAVDLVVFRDRPEPPVAFPAGDSGSRLEAALRRAPVDGGTALAPLDFRRAALPHTEAELWILMSDGLRTLGEALPPLGDVPVWPVTGATDADRGVLRHLAAQSGGELIDLVALDAEAAVAALTTPRPRLLRVVPTPADAVADVQVAPRADRGRVHLTGRLLADRAELTFVYGTGGTVRDRHTVMIQRATAARTDAGVGPVAVAWAQGRAEMLGLFPDRNEAELLALGQRFGLVTAGTSLLVLETLAQHLEHRVEPAASRAALRSQYLARLGELDKKRQRKETDQLEQVVRLWQERVRWWETEFSVPPGWRWSPPKPAQGIPGRPGLFPMPAPESPAGAVAPLIRAEMSGAAGPAAERAAKSADDTGRGAASAAIVIKPWDPRVPYLDALRRAAPGTAYATYLAQRKEHASPAFFLDCAGFFLEAGEKPLGVRILTNLAELRIDHAALLRVMAWRLTQAGELDLAVQVLERVLRLRPEEPQSRRDLALVLADRAEARNSADDATRAVALLWEVGRQRWDRFPDVEMIALMELNRVLARAERRGSGQVRAEHVDPRVRRLLDVDLRISLSWDQDLTDVDLHVFEPTEEHASYSHRQTRIGGLVSHDVTEGYGPEEYTVRRATPGAYAVKAHYYGSRQQTLIGPATLTATVYTNWGRPDEKREVLTLRLDRPREMEDVGVVQIGGAAREPGKGADRTLDTFRALKRGMTADAVTVTVGQPDEVGGTGAIELRYRLGDGAEVRVQVAGAGGVTSVRHVTRDAELELLR
jgi:hypothetical protein